ncbi:MAG: histidine--tRNA ligase [Cryobacterium sp.]|nr:histidine--tRNA ligase [Oligoflexia bacterium]
MAFLSTQPYKGTRDFYPDDLQIRDWIFSKMREVCASFGYREYDAPMLEPFELYAAKSGEEIVNQQLYWMMDKGDRKMAVRPEMTPSMARMVAGKIHELPKPVRWFSIPNLWRYERPQRGRLREHWQLNVDVLGADPLYADAELLTLAFSMIRKFGGEAHVSIRVNNRRLMDELFGKRMGLSAENTLKVTKAIDARPKIGEEKYAAALSEAGVTDAQRKDLESFFSSSLEKVATDFPCAGSEELVKLFRLLEESGIAASGSEAKVVFDPTIMRGLDYYTGTVFEMFDTSPENNRAMFGGGRYDNLVGLFGKDKLSGVGFGMGDVTLRDFLETHSLLPKMPGTVDVFVSLPKEESRGQAERIARDLREAGLRVITPLEVGGFGTQLKQAVKHGARHAVLFGDAEFAEGKVLIKNLALNSQETVAFGEIVEKIRG